MTPSEPGDWHLVVPVKGGSAAKSRLHPPPGVSRAELATAIAHDCLTAATSGMPAGRVLVVTGDGHVAGLARSLGAEVQADPGAGLNAAVAAGVAAARGSAPDGALAAREADVAVLLGDLPSLLPSDLMDALAAATAYEHAVVPDAAGTGTVLLTARGLAGPTAAFGPGSAARHRDAGHTVLDLDLPRLRTDVDDDRSLVEAIALGVGPHTRRCLAAGGVTLPPMQASVHTFDETSGAGTALLDDGREVTFSESVFGASALRHLRGGQRISIDLGQDGTTVERLWIVGIGDDQRIG